MTIEDLKDSRLTKEAPGNGWVLAYLRREVLFHPYQTLNEIEDELAGRELLELHLFNREKEYRVAVSSSRRFPAGYAEHTALFPNEKQSVYSERILTDDALLSASSAIRVLNHFSFDENGMLHIDDYRLIAED